jgi:membrane peptidoglycan carboxypeptidase
MAAKTGTTDDARDIYLCAYTPNVVAAFWMGYDEKVMGNIPNGWNYTTAVLRTVFSELFKTLPAEPFRAVPDGVTRVEVCAKSGLLPSDQCLEAGVTTTDYFLANHVPRVTCNMHLLLDICKESGLLANEFCPKSSVIRKAFFDRPDYIITDGRWLKGAGRKPLDADDKAPTEKCGVHTEFGGRVTSFIAEARRNDIRLQWRYRGPRVDEFIIYRQIEGETNPEFLVRLASNQRRYNDNAVVPGKTYIYSLYAVYKHGLSEPAIARATFRDRS